MVMGGPTHALQRMGPDAAPLNAMSLGGRRTASGVGGFQTVSCLFRILRIPWQGGSI
jgi:hypothetical protein